MTTHNCPECGQPCACADGQDNEFACNHCDEIDPDDMPDETIVQED